MALTKCAHPEENTNVKQMGVTIIALATAALVVALLAFGWPVLLVGAPLFLVIVLVLAVVRLWEMAGRRLEQRKAAQWSTADVPAGGLMSGFFEASAIADYPVRPTVRR